MEDEIIHDRLGVPYRIHFQTAGHLWTITLKQRNTTAGHARCGVEGDALRLREIVVFSSSTSSETAGARLLRKLTRQPEPMTAFQRRGLGTQMIDYIVKQASAAKLKEIHGIITRADFERSPDLPRWYYRRGFTVTPIEGDARRHASISMEL